MVRMVKRRVPRGIWIPVRPVRGSMRLPMGALARRHLRADAAATLAAQDGRTP